MFLFFLTFEAGHVLKVVLKFWPNLRLNVLIKFVLKKTKECIEDKTEKNLKPQINVEKKKEDYQEEKPNFLQ